MNDAYSIAEAKNNLSGLVHAAEQGYPVRLTRRGKPVAVLISTEQYERLSKPRKKIEWSAAVIDTKNFKFDRDEANER
jgi:prevent-host-death family protein